MSKTTFCQPLFRAPFPEVYKVLRLPKNELEASEVLRLPHGIIIMSKIKNKDCFIIRDFRPFDNVVQVHHTLHLPLKMISTSTSHFDPRLPTILQCAESAAPAVRMKKCLVTPGTQNDVQNAPDVPRLPQEMDITAAQKTTAR